MPKSIQGYADCRGGWNADAVPELLADNELTQADDVDLDLRGGVNRRKAWMRIDDGISVTGTMYQLIEWPRNNGSLVLLGVHDSALVEIEGGGSLSTVQTLAGQHIGHCVFNDRFYFTDGSEYRTYDGSSVSVVSPDSATDNDLGPIKRCKWLLWHPSSFRIFAAGDTMNPATLYYSEPNKPNYFKNTSKMVPTTGDGPIQGIALFGDAVVVFFRNSVWAWRGSDPMTDATWQKLPVPHGTQSPDTIALTPDSLTYLGDRGLYAMTLPLLGYSIVTSPDRGLVPNIAENKVTSVMSAISNKSTASGVYDPTTGKYYLAYSIGLESYVLVFDWALGAFTRYTVPGKVHSLVRRQDGTILIGLKGAIAALSGIGDDYTGPVMPVIQLAYRNLGIPLVTKKLWKVHVGGNVPGAEFKIATRWLEEDHTLRIGATGFVWGDPWGAPWGRTEIPWQCTRTRLLGDVFTFTLRGNGEDFQFRALVVEFRPTSRKGR